MNITTPDNAREALSMDPQEAWKRIVEIGNLAARLRFHELRGDDEKPSTPDWERGARAGLSAYREAFELVRLYAPQWADPHDTSHDPTLAAAAQSALEAAR